jgi:hypothetical protein
MITMDASVHIRNNIASQNAKTSSSSNAEDEIETSTISGVTEVIPGGFHQEAIKSSDIAYNRPVVATMSSDRTVRYART